MTRIFLITWLLLTCSHTAHSLEITFQPHGSVESSTIRLGDIVRFDEDTEMTRALSSQVVGQASIPGNRVSIDSIKVKQHLLTIKSLPQDIRWFGSPTVSVLRLGTKISTDKIQTIIADYIQDNQAQLPQAEIRFVPNALPLPFTLPKGGISYQVIPSNPNIIGSSQFTLIFRVDGKVVKNMSVRGKVEALAEVVIAKTPLKKGTILRAHNLSTQIMNISSLRNPGLEASDLIGKKLTRTLRSGVPVLLSMVKSLPVVKRGDRVKIVINSGQLHLSATGLARKDGALHDIIRVQNVNSQKIVYCRVAAPGLVEVIL